MKRSLCIALLALIQTPVSAQSDPGIRFQAQTLGGKSLNQDDFKNNVLLIDYWGTWCPPCREAIPFLEELYGKYKHHGLEIIGFTYERGSGDPATKVREFAAANHITYPLALGTKEQMRLVKNFQGYPTMLFLRRGLVFDHKKVGFAKSSQAEMEAWIRKALGLDDADAQPQAVHPEPEPEELAEGVIFRPGEGDHGFDFEAEDVDGKRIEFAAYRGKPVILALTSTWDQEAVVTSTLLQELHRQYSAGGCVVLAASLEMSRDHKTKVEVIKGFREKHNLSYPLIPAGLSFQKKIHLLSGLPLFLLFDSEGVLVLREAGSGEAVAAKIRAKMEELLR